MIQRPQSILLALVAIAYVLMAFAPLWTLNFNNLEVTLNSTESVLINQNGEELGSNSNIYLLAICACGAILSIVTLFLFKNRSLQAKLSAFSTVILVGFVGLTVFLAFPQALELANQNTGGDYGWGFYLTVVILLLNFIANRLIRKDEALVKSVDRIR